MKLQIRTTFDFGKLASKIEVIIQSTSSTIAKQWETETEKNIDSQRGRDGSKLDDNTPYTKLLKGQNKPVMIDKGWLYQSIKSNKDTLSMNAYGWWNHTGKEPGYKKRPKRPFIGVSKGHPNYESNSKEVMKGVYKDIRKALKK